MNGHLLALYVVAVFLAMIAPGPDMMFVVATGARGGPRVGLLAALGAATSEIVQITAVAAGLAALFAAAPAAFTALGVRRPRAPRARRRSAGIRPVRSAARRTAASAWRGR